MGKRRSDERHEAFGMRRRRRARRGTMRSDDADGQRIIYASQHELLLPSVSPRLVSDEEPSLPLSIFSTRLSALQAIVRYLHETRHLSFSEIAALLNRSQKTVWTTYQAARDEPFDYDAYVLSIPIARFSSRALAPLETIVAYLVELGFSNVDAARLLRLDPRTTWTVKRRAQRKQGVAP